MVYGISNEMDERVGYLVKHALIEFCPFSANHQRNVLPFARSEFSHKTTESLEDLSYREHPESQGALLNVRSYPLKAREKIVQPIRAFVISKKTFVLNDLLHHRVDNHHLTDEIHEAVEFSEVNPDR